MLQSKEVYAIHFIQILSKATLKFGMKSVYIFFSVSFFFFFSVTDQMGIIYVSGIFQQFAYKTAFEPSP